MARISPLIAGALLTLGCAGTATAGGGMPMPKEDHHHDTPKQKSACSSCGGGGKTDPAARRQASGDAGNRSKSSGESGGISVSSGGGVMPGTVSPGDLSALGGSMDQADADWQAQRQGSLDILSGLNTLTNKAAGRGMLSLPDKNDVAVTAAQVGHRVQGALSPSANPSGAGNSPPATIPASSQDPATEYLENFDILTAATSSGAGGPGFGMSGRDIVEIANGTPVMGPPPVHTQPAGTQPVAIITAGVPVNAPPLGDTSQSSTAVPPTAAPASDWTNLTPLDPGPAPGRPDPAAQQAAASAMAGQYADPAPGRPDPAAQQAAASAMAGQYAGPAPTPPSPGAATQQDVAGQMAQDATNSAPDPAASPPTATPAPSATPATPTPAPAADPTIIDPYKSKHQQLQDLLNE